MNALSQQDAKAKWSIANSIWYNKGFQIDGTFLQTNADYYLADARMLDFSSASAPGTINGWVKEKTDGKIDKIVTSIQPDVVMYLINAVWFKADWKTPFKTSGTQPGTFHGPSADTQAKFLNRTGSITYLKSSICEGILMPYSDERFAFVAVMPEGSRSPRQMIADMAPSDLSALLKSGTDEQISLRIPKFETRYEIDLIDPLRQMGMKAAFIPDVADFSLMNSDRQKNLYISGVKQKTYCRVDEKGTEAAAATSVEMTTTAMPLSDMELVFDRPFMYGILDVKTGVPVFLGLMENPN
jgi:serpin B